MPGILLQPCGSQPCSNLVETGMCAVHAKLRDQARGTTTNRGYDGKWERVRASFLKARCMDCGARPVVTCEQCGGTGLAHAFCAECLSEGRLTPTAEVDHIIPFRGPQELILSLQEHGDLRLSWRNLQGLCLDHHGAKTVAEQNGLSLSGYQAARRRRALVEILE